VPAVALLLAFAVANESFVHWSACARKAAIVVRLLLLLLLLLRSLARAQNQALYCYVTMSKYTATACAAAILPTLAVYTAVHVLSYMNI
jgi:hypothetical protein